MEMSTNSRYLRRTTCVKCSEKGNVVLNGKDVYCTRCFDDYCLHKFRSSFGRHKIFKGRMERVLVAVSGGPVSAGILLDLVVRSCHENAHKKLLVQPEIVHILEPRPDQRDNVTWINHRPFNEFKNIPIHFIHFGNIFDNDPAAGLVSGTITHLPEKLGSFSNQPMMDKLFDSFASDTSRMDFYRRLKTLLLVLAARKLGIRYVIVGDTCTALSSRILSNSTQGRGGQVPDDVNVLDKRWNSVTNHGVNIVRPLREFQNREIAYYDHFNRLYRETAFLFGKPPVLGQTPSLQSASDDFVDSLQSQFPATVCTLFASASKLLPSRNPTKMNDDNVSSNSQKCHLCSSVIDFSHDVESNQLLGFCYGCTVTLSDLNDRKCLPPCLM